MTTGDDALDFVLEGGPRAFSPGVPEHVREEIAKSPSLHWFNLMLTQKAQEERLSILAEIRQIGRENREIEWKATDSLGVPKCRIPLRAYLIAEAMFGKGCWTDEFEDEFLEAYPELRITVKRGTKGQKYKGTERN